MQFVNDPSEFPPVGAPAGVLVGPRTMSGEAFLWVPGGDAEALVRLFGEHQLVNVGGEVFQRLPDGTLAPASFLKAQVVVIKPPAGDTFVLPLSDVTRQYARVDAGWVSATVTKREVDPAEFAVVDAEPVKRGPGRPKGSTSKKPAVTEV